MTTSPVSRKITPQTIQGIYQMTLEGKTKREMSKVLGISTDTIKRLRSGRYPSLDADTAAACHQAFGTENTLQAAIPPGGCAASAATGADVPATPFERPKVGYFPRAKKLASASYQHSAIRMPWFSRVNSSMHWHPRKSRRSQASSRVSRTSSSDSVIRLCRRDNTISGNIGGIDR